MNDVTHDEDDGQVLKNSVDRNAEVLLSGRVNAGPGMKRGDPTDQTFRASVDDCNEQETDGKPAFRVLKVKIAERERAKAFCNDHTGHADDRLNSK